MFGCEANSLNQNWDKLDTFCADYNEAAYCVYKLR